MVVAQRPEDVEEVTGAGHGDVGQPQLFLYLPVAAGRHVRGETAVSGMNQVDGVPLQPLGGVDCRKHQPVFIHRWWTGEVSGGDRRVKDEVNQELATGGIAGGQLPEMLDIALAGFRVLVVPFQNRIVETANHLDMGRWRTFGKRRQAGEQSAKASQVFASRRRPRETGHRGRVEAVIADVVYDRPGRYRADATEELEDTEPGDFVAWVLYDTKEADEVLDVGHLQETQATVLVERDIAPRQLQFQRCRMRRGAKEDGLLAERYPLLIVLQYLADDDVILLAVVNTGNELGLLAAAACRPEVFRVALPRLTYHPVGRFQNRWGGAVVLLKGDDRGSGELLRKIEHVAHCRRAEAVDALGVVADDGEVVLPLGPHPAKNARLDVVGVLVLIDEDVVKAPADRLRQRRILEHVVEVEQEIVIVKHALALLALDVLTEEAFEFVAPHQAPGEVSTQDCLQVFVAADAPRVDVETGALAREARLLTGKGEVIADDVKEVFGVASVNDGEIRREAD